MSNPDRRGSALFILNALSIDLMHLNQAIINGDIVSPRKAKPVADRLLEAARQDLLGIGAVDLSLDHYAAPGGFIGIMYFFKLDDEPHTGKLVPVAR